MTEMDARKLIASIASKRKKRQDAVDELTEQLNEAVIAGYKAGIRPTELAGLTGLSRQRIHQIITGTR